MAAQSGSDIRGHVLTRVAFFSDERDQLEDRYLSELFPDPWDFIELCQDLEETYGFDASVLRGWPAGTRLGAVEAEGCPRCDGG